MVFGSKDYFTVFEDRAVRGICERFEQGTGRLTPPFSRMGLDCVGAVARTTYE
jgi:hypothetical protein